MKNETQFLSEALKVLCPNGASYNGVDIIPTSDPVPTKVEIDAQITILKTEYATQEYARNRQAEYPTIAELTVALYDTDDKSAVEAKRASVKAKYPKPD